MKFIIGLFIWIILFILLIIPFALITFGKIIVVTFHTRRRTRVSSTSPRDAEEWFSLSPADCMFAVDSSWIKGVVNFGAILRLKMRKEGARFTVEQLRERFDEVFLQDNIEGGKYDKLSSYLIKHGMHVYRVHTTKIDLKDHIYQVEFDEGGNQSLEDFLAEWILIGYKEKKPCWEMMMIAIQPKEQKTYPGKDGNFITDQDQQVVIAFKIHHSLADGYSLLHILDKLTRNTSPYLVRDFNDSLWTEIKQMVEAPTNLGVMSPPGGENHFRVKLSDEKKFEWMLSFTSFPLEKLKAFRRKHGVHMTSIILTIIIGAQRKFLLNDKKIDKLPEKIAIAATLGYPRHPTKDPKSSNRDKLCNHWVTAFGKASFGEQDLLILLKQVDKELRNFEEKGLGKFFRRVMLPMIWSLQSIFMKMAGGSNQDSLSFGAGSTSIVGGDNYSLLGCPIDSIHPYFAFHDINPAMPFSCFTFSHSGKLEVTFGVHPSVYKDQETLDRVLKVYCHEEFKALMEC